MFAVGDRFGDEGDFDVRSQFRQTLGGAVATHIRVVDPWIQCAVPVILGIVMWIGMGLRQPGIFAMTSGTSGKSRAEAELKE